MARGGWSPPLETIATALRMLGKEMAPTYIQTPLSICARLNIFPKSQEQVPVKTGALKDTGRINKAQINQSGTRVRIEIAYGGLSKQFGKFVRYAVIQHETMHYKHPNGGKAKYLTDPGFESLKQLEKEVMYFGKMGFVNVFSKLGLRISFK